MNTDHRKGCVYGPCGQTVPPPISLVILAEYGVYKVFWSERTVAVAGERPKEREPVCGGHYGVSDRFSRDELRQLYERLNSDSFQAPLTNCGDPVKRFTFSVVLFKNRERYNKSLSVGWAYSPALNPLGRDRCLYRGVQYLVAKAFASIEEARTTNSQFRVVREPHCDCSRRAAPGVVIMPYDSISEWVTYPGPEEELWQK
jgi:hypothetical protein